MTKSRVGTEPDRTLPSWIASIRTGERLVYAAVALIIAIGVILARFAPEFLDDLYLVEDGILEWLTVALLLFCAGLCIERARRLRSVRPALFRLSLGLFALAFLFVAGEEISWGQRIFALESPQWVQENNQQGELNLHNLMVGEFSVNKVIFGQILTVTLVIYLYVLPWMASRWRRISRLVERVALPLPTLVQALAFPPAMLLPELLIESSKADEMVEACGALILALIFYYPKNGYIYSAAWAGPQDV